MLSLKLPSTTWIGTLVPSEEFKDTVTSIPLGETRTLPPLFKFYLIFKYLNNKTLCFHKHKDSFNIRKPTNVIHYNSGLVEKIIL